MKRELSLTFGGGGARGAYQVGVLDFMARKYPKLNAPILTGVSAGAINASHLANHTGSFRQKVDALIDLWSTLTVDHVFRVDNTALIMGLLKWGFQLTMLGGRKHSPEVRGFVDTEPLAVFLRKALGCCEDSLAGIQTNLERGNLRAVALTTTSYATGRTITWCEGRNIQTWERPDRIGIPTRLQLGHVLASAALPLFFPAVQIQGVWYGDGGLRLHSPLAPSIHLGASHILAVSTRYNRTLDEAAVPDFVGYPPPAQIAGVLMNAIFLDLLDQDAANLQRVNELLRSTKPEARGDLRPVELFIVRPSMDLGKLAGEYESKLPGLFRFLTRRLGTRKTNSSDLISLVMFQPDYLKKLIELGARDAEACEEELDAFLIGAGVC
ncbi:MAG: NTE family protein [Planctomycetota bacterium]|jgi:NTE family protein